MDGFKLVTTRLIVALFLTLLIHPQLNAEDDNSILDIPSDFNLVGIYHTQSKIKVHNGKAIKQLIPETVYKVFGNGKSIRVYNSEVPDAFHQYEIYRSDGISILNSDGTTRVLPGMQARNVNGALLKQLSVSPTSLTITLIPPLSDAVTIIYAVRAEKK